MDTPPWTTLVAAMPGHTRSTFRGARAALNHRFTLVRTPPQSRATHNDKRHSAASNAHVSVKAQRAASVTLHAATATRSRTVRTQTDPPPTPGRSRAPPVPIRHKQTRGGFAPPGPQLILWPSSKREARAGPEPPFRRSPVVVLRLVHPDP